MTATRPFLLDVDKDLNFCFVDADSSSIGSANFIMRGELSFDSGTERKYAMASYVSRHSRMPANYIFHTAFTGSTLVSRALHSAPEVVSLKEPNILLDLSMASTVLASNDLAPYLETVLAELSQPWTENGQVIIKPTNSCNRLVMDIFGKFRGDRVLFLYSTLEEFMVSCLKKMPQAQNQLNLMAHHLLPESELEKNCRIPRNLEFNIIEACVLSWFVSIEYFSRAIEILPADSWMIVHYRDLKSEPMPVVRNIGRHFRLPEEFLVDEAIKPKLQVDSKSTDKVFDSQKFTRGKDAVYNAYGEEIRKGLVWAESHIARHVKISPAFKIT